ncbi:undifferentiated embryonic cell transcription factor 1 [Marmota marmota marmota]|uniref:undifferentiated embryonic cell transcription factor 1 n=1 Tax=Marmota marmota marmota TaxID=9994 RepID=UPI000762ADE1|nr:undifferentiated embryonic cell transcription factor 1 [Marmota marmota marmota]
MLLRPRRPPPLAPPGPPSPDSPDADLRPTGDGPGTPPVGPTTLGALAEPESPQSPVSPGSAQRTPWSARETELLLGTLLQPAVWRSLLLDRRQALPTYRRVSAALARQQVRRTPAQCRRRYKFLKDKLRDAQGQPPGPFDALRAPQAAPPSLNAALLQTLTHLGDIVAVLGPLRDQLLTLNQHVEQLRGSFDQTVSLAVGFILGSAAAERGVLRDPRE